MLKIGIELKQAGETLNIRMLEATKKQLESASEMEKITAQLIKEVLDENLLDLLNTKETEKEK